ncbi:MAG: type 4a pilus biogenesis protein PilO [Candidatus Omnitrophica bacterium]|nr:type 4a pilus biogenesis protein PilO [Candidatus Omnitrophota bacterium]
MNLKDLNKIDIKDLQNIDWSQIKNRVLTQPDLAINIVMSLITVIILFTTFDKYKATSKIFNDEITDLEKRLAAFEKFEDTEKQTKEFLDKIPKAIGSDQVIQTLSEFAVRRSIQILSFSPAQKKSNNFVSLTSVEVNVASENYANLVLFIRDIENSPYPIRIINWAGLPMDEYSSTSQWSRRQPSMAPPVITDKKGYIKATITIESVELKNV